MSKPKRLGTGRSRQRAQRARPAKPAVATPPTNVPTAPQGRLVPSLLDAMQDGREYTSIVDARPADPAGILADTKRAMSEIQGIRGRPLLCYVGNAVKAVPNTGIESSDYLPFVEMIASVPSSASEVDVFLASPGGSAETVAKLVEALRARFSRVHFIVAGDAMSAGTLFVMAGDSICMTRDAYLGPIDPQVPSRDGRFVPAQALLTLLAKIQKDGEERLANGLQPEWSHIVLLKNLDQKELGHAISASEYSINMATEFLATYKFRDWSTTDSGRQVTPEYRRERARQIAEALCSHERWRAHGHRINRDILWGTIRLRIERPEDVDGLDRAIRRLWALWYYTFDKANVAKVLMAEDYVFARTVQG